jgi:hypothetical protein
VVSWAEDGHLWGYDPVDEEFRGGSAAMGSGDPGPFVLASPGSVNLNGVSRLQRYLQPQQFNPLNCFGATVKWSVISSDFTTYLPPGHNSIGPVLYITDALNWAEGYVPTITEIVNNFTYRYWPSGFATTPQTKEWDIAGLKPLAGTEMSPNRKFWVAVVPATRNDSVEPVPIASIQNTFGRALSLWTNRTPTKPVITAPVNGVTVSPGATFTLTYDPNDPDALTPDGANGANADLAGVQIQYAAPPTLDNPNPTWADLPRVNSDGDTVALSWYIESTENGQAGDSTLLTARGSTITAGTDTVLPGNGVLPGGTWQLRVRTFDYGHPYPNSYRPAGYMNGGLLFPENMPSSMTSPWSDPITVNVPSQVSPPLLIAPVDNVAVQEDTTVRLSWKHRSAFVTPKGQMAREVQIKRVVDPTWATVFAGPSSQQYGDLPAVYVAPPDVPDQEYLTDGTFEGGTTGGWSIYNAFLPDFPLDGSANVSNVNNAGNAHGGSRYLNINYTGSYYPGFGKIITLDPDHDQFHFTGWYFPTANITFAYYTGIQWLDGSDNPLPEEDQNGGFTRFMSEDPWTPATWLPIDTGMVDKPAGAVKARLYATGFGLATTGYAGSRLDDVSFIGHSTSNTDDFTLDATNRYEWRARTRDTDGVWSSYSPSEKFWIVPGAGTGGVRPVPSETIDGATLGCGTHTIDIYRRGGKDHVGTLRGVTHVDWGRMRDDISTSKVIIQDWDIDCGNLLAQLQTWAYEVVIHRDNGYSNDRVWEGPITLLTYETDKVTIQAKDVMGYAYRRIIKQQMKDSGTGNGTTVVDRARRVIQNVFAPDDPNILAYLRVLAQEDDAMQYRSTPAYSRTAFEEIDDMAANAGLDYTCVGRSILLWGTKHRIGTLPEFTDADFAEAPIVSEYGMSMANRYVVSDGNGVWGEATRLDVSGNDSTYGLVEMLSSTWASDSSEDSGTYTQEGLQTVIESFEEFAERSISDRFPPPVVVRLPDNTSIQPGAVVSIQHLVPGVVIPLRSNSTLRSVVQSQKLDSITVTEEAGKESIQITMSPFTRDDASTGGEVEA